MSNPQGLSEPKMLSDSKMLSDLPALSDRAAQDMVRRHPLAGLPLPGGDGLSVTLAPDAARFILRGAPENGVAFGPAAPEKLRASVAGNRAALWLGPDELLLMAPGEEAAIIEPQLGAALAAGSFALVDVSHRQVGLRLQGKLAARCLSAGCPLDLRLKAFPVGMATRTMFLKAEITLWRQAEEQFHVEIGRSFAPYLIGHLAEALRGAEGL